MTPQQTAEHLGLTFEKQTPGYLNLCICSGNQLISSGHVSTAKGKLGAGLTTEEGYGAAGIAPQDSKLRLEHIRILEWPSGDQSTWLRELRAGVH